LPQQLHSADLSGPFYITCVQKVNRKLSHNNAVRSFSAYYSDWNHQNLTMNWKSHASMHTITSSLAKNGTKITQKRIISRWRN